MDKVVVGGVPVDRLRSDEWTDLLVSDWRRKRQTGAPPKVVTTANGQVISLFAQDRAYREAVLAADHVAADGMSVVFASQLATTTPLTERVATTDWFHSAAAAAATHRMKFYLLGASLEANTRAAKRACELYPDLILAGTRDGYFPRDDIPRIAKDVVASGADVLWIGVGNPEQVLLAHAFKTLAPTLTWVRTCGGLFDFLSGERKRAPGTMQRLGLEWFYRVVQEPKRLAWRYATTNVHAAYRMARYSGAATPASPLSAGASRQA